MRDNPYYCYSYKQNMPAIDTASAIEREVCGSVAEGMLWFEIDPEEPTVTPAELCRASHGR